MFESKHQTLLPWPQFFRRIGFSLLLAGGIVAVALSIGVIGYHLIAKLAWIDAILNAAMILTGMGPVDPLKTVAAKLFASAYAIFSGVIFITVMGFLLAPLLHRLMHKFHLDQDQPEDEADA